MKVYIGPYRKRDDGRTIRVRIDVDDTYCCDNTLANIIYPLLMQFKKVNDAHPCDLSFGEWDEILDKMIFSFGTVIQSIEPWNDVETEREINKGFELFGKYFKHLWW